jgi:hypothetical protein
MANWQRRYGKPARFDKTNEQPAACRDHLRDNRRDHLRDNRTNCSESITFF